MEVFSVNQETRQLVSSSQSSEANQGNFLELLVAQLRNQDPLDPVKNEDFVAQLAQLENLEETKKMSKNLANIVNGQEFASASTLIGKEVLGAITNSEGESREIKGVVKSVSQVDGEVRLKVETKEGVLEEIKIGNVAEIRNVAELAF